MGTYWGADGKTVDGRFEIAGSKVSEGIADMVLNTQGTLLASAARTANPQSADQTNYNAKGVIIVLNVTVASGTGGLQVSIAAKDPVSGLPYALNVLPIAFTTIGTYAYELYPGSTSAAGSTAGNLVQRTAGALPRTWRIEVVHGNTTSYTYSVGYALIL